MKSGKLGRKAVLVAVLKLKSDLDILLKEKWYRIPLAFLPKRRFSYVALYQPAGFGGSGKRIEYYGRVSKREVKKRIELLPSEGTHPRAHDDYLKVSFSKIEKLEKPIRNVIPRRVSFGFTTLKKLRSARDVLELYGVPATEQMIERGLARRGIEVVSEYTVVSDRPPRSSGAARKRYRIDLVIFCKHGAVAIECDNLKAHSSKAQQAKDTAKDKLLKSLGFYVIRLGEKEIIDNLEYCLRGIQKKVKSLS